MNRHLRWLAVVMAIAVLGCQQSDTSTTETSATSTETPAAPAANEVTTASGLKIVELAAGSGEVAATGDSVGVHYTGWLTDSTQFDSSRGTDQPLWFQIGAGGVIQGWEEGVAGMRVGGRRKLTIPPSLGYGEKGFPGVIPPNATLVFDVELVEVRKK
jgi:FKBP-type peptidyl-prolyl cis-trans isomerase